MGAMEEMQSPSVALSFHFYFIKYDYKTVGHILVKCNSFEDGDHSGASLTSVHTAFDF